MKWFEEVSGVSGLVEVVGDRVSTVRKSFERGNGGEEAAWFFFSPLGFLVAFLI